MNLLTLRIWSRLGEHLARTFLYYLFVYVHLVHFLNTYCYLKSHCYCWWHGLVCLPFYLKLLSCRCPYFMTRELHKDVDIVFAPYNYLIDPWFRKGLGIEWKDSILIFDEAHNLVRRKSQMLTWTICTWNS